MNPTRVGFTLLVPSISQKSGDFCTASWTWFFDGLGVSVIPNRSFGTSGSSPARATAQAARVRAANSVQSRAPSFRDISAILSERGMRVVGSDGLNRPSAPPGRS